jgi:predicted HTH transcriptional regulator
MLNIKEILSKGETFHLEVKKASGKLPDSLWESYSAFANSDGGNILLGVTEENKKLTVSGVADAQAKIKTLWDLLNNRQKVNLNILVERNIYVQKTDGKDVIVIEVPRADRRDKPVFINNDLLNGTFRRNADGDYHCIESEIKSMLRDQSEIAIDGRVIEELAIADLDRDTIVGYRNHFASLTGSCVEPA